MTQRFIGVDIGGTASRWVIADADGTTIARGAAPGATGHLFNPAERNRFAATIGAISAETHAHLPVAAAFLGVTGLGERAFDEARAIAGAALGLDPARIGTSDDMELAFRAAFAPGAGHLVSAGTGSVGLHVAADGTLVRVGGRGLLIDDGGSGTWIALTALDNLYRIIDETGGTGEAGILAEELFAAMGGDDWSATRAYVYGSDRGRIGALAQAVARAADRGDAIALANLERAAEELARLGRALVKRAGNLPIGYVGGVIGLHQSIKSALIAALPGCHVVFPQIDAARHAAVMARQFA
ncbi:N-acetylglucosamine kinase [Devosia nitrariae]|uniref:N-acetylglucosamine kinase n=1 Tax=Devosia nitrariae TaxID=2071872 RepID=A0ABQ5W430_9HYPH|nr:BadF/BadG/BcrA/BcrD ATPase family protein [Devosia nitrariae]GLQ54690.1 N-acetylglucosamine kinase [Devosia nitrariae]